jgi:hypothetical protein
MIMLLSRLALAAGAAVCLPALFPTTTAAQCEGRVLSEVYITEGFGGFGGDLEAQDAFGHGVTAVGDLDDDGVPDLLIGAPCANDPGPGQTYGNVWILFMNSDGTVRDEQRIGIGSGGFGGVFDDPAWFGMDATGLGDLNGDGVEDIAVGVPGDDDGGIPQSGRGALWILFMTTAGRVSSERKISATHGGFTGSLDTIDNFGHSVANIGDINGDGTIDLAVGAPFDDDGGHNAGAVYILFMHSGGWTTSTTKITEGAGGFTGPLSAWDEFGWSAEGIGDLDNDGVGDLAVGTPGNGSGRVWVLFLNSDGTVRAEQEVGLSTGGFGGSMEQYDALGHKIASMGDFDGDGVEDMMVAAQGDDDGADNAGAIWLLLMNSDGTVSGERKISATQGAFGGTLFEDDWFGEPALLGDLNGDGTPEVAVGAPGLLTGGTGRAWILSVCDGDFAAASTFRNDSGGTNPTGYTAPRPIMGAAWQPSVDNSGMNNSGAGVVGYRASSEFLLSGIGDWVLINPLLGPELLHILPATGTGVVNFTLNIPTDWTLCGATVSTQGYGFGGSGGTRLHNAFDLVLGDS